MVSSSKRHYFLRLLTFHSQPRTVDAASFIQMHPLANDQPRVWRGIYFLTATIFLLPPSP